MLHPLGECKTIMIKETQETDQINTQRTARRIALDALARREYAVHELYTKLAAKGFSHEVIEALIAQLCAEKLLSNERYAAAYIHAHANKGHGPVRVRQSLHSHAIDSDLSQSLLDEIDWYARAREVRCKRFGADLPHTAKEYAQQARFLSYRGFSSAHIHAALRAQEEE
jgi:regulatory protein